jgi:outer membrane protein
MRFGIAAFAAALLLATPTLAADAGTWEVRLRALEVVPDVGSSVNIGGKLNITDSVVPEIDFSYFLTSHWALELIAGTTKHSIYYNGNTKLGTAYLLPPTLTLQYHPGRIGVFEPYIGAGPNFTLFYDKSVGPLGKLRTTDNWGFAFQLGTDILMSQDGRYVLNVDVKKLFLGTHASFSGAAVTANVDINPWIIGTGVGIRF